MPEMLTRWLIMGSGRCGIQLARAMVASGIPLAGVLVHSGRGRARVHRLLPGVRPLAPARELPHADALLIAVPDNRLSECDAELAARVSGRVRVALHTSGLHPGAVLDHVRQRGVAVGSFHPLMSFPAPGGPPVRLAGALATVEGDAAAVRAGLALARALAMAGRRLAAADKPRYHAAAVIAANLTHVLVAEARATLVGVGLGRGEAVAALRPLVDGAVASALAAVGLERLTGPISRGDASTVVSHLAALDPMAAAAYRAVGRLAVDRLGLAELPSTVTKSALDSVLRALTDTEACASVPGDERV
jgi:predicted short-subunit dehydrogenase-like oxidoreductase (DUF2520 family)